MRILVSGSRHWTERSIIRMELSRFLLDPPDKVLHTVVHGEAAGADALAATTALSTGHAAQGYPANWGRWGAAAGPIRNREMVESGVDILFAFRLAHSRGTSNAIDLARARDIKTIVWDCDDGDYTRLRRTVLG